MLTRLPGWIVDDATSVENESAPYRDLTPSERGALLASACRAAARILRSRPDSAEILAMRDPLPESSERALAALRKRYRTSRTRGDGI